MSYLLRATEVQEILQICNSSAYNVIKELNQELEDKGFRTVRGKVNKSYLYERYGIEVKKEVSND